MIIKSFYPIILLLIICGDHNNAKVIKGLYVLRYQKEDLIKFGKSKNELPIDYEVEKYFLPLDSNGSHEDLARKIIHGKILSGKNQLFLLPSPEFQHTIENFIKNAPMADYVINIPNKLKDRTYWSIDANGEFFYALYTLEGDVIAKKLENSLKNRLILNSNINILSNQDSIDCHFIWHIFKLEEYELSASEFTPFRF